jgi:hypothetical protein
MLDPNRFSEAAIKWTLFILLIKGLSEVLKAAFQ